MNAPEPALDAFLVKSGLASALGVSHWTPLAGGVSSDIWRVDSGSRVFCVKRALPTLKVAAEWKAPVERNAFEWEYMRVVGGIAPGHVPDLIAQDKEHGLFAMSWLAPEQNPVWKAELLAGRVNVAAAAAMGDLLGRIHAATAADSSLPERFATDGNFHALRIEPYLLATARAHPDLADRLEHLADRTARTRRALVHGDVSPKNILLGRQGPVLLDAECAWFGDPAFDLAFCLNHLVIKQRVIPAVAAALGESVRAMVGTYMARVDWEAPVEIEARVASLLPALALARVDGKSPLEYLDEPQRARLRAAARSALAANPRAVAQAHELLMR